MSDANIQNQIDGLNTKLDLLLEYVNEQRLKSETIEDLIADVSIIGKDMYDSTVEELEVQQIEIEPAELTHLGIIFLRNIKTFITLMNTMESVIDLMKEVGPIANEVIIDISKKLGEFEDKGYFDMTRDLMGTMDNAVRVYSSIDSKNVPEYGLWKTMKEMNSPEMKKSLGFMMTFMKEFSKTTFNK